MKTLTYQLRDLKKLMICIGFEDENNRTQVRIDCGEVFGEYPNAAVSMKVQAPKGGIYPATVTREGNMILWTVRDCDVANKGSGEFQLTFTDGNTVIKTCVGRFHVDRSLKGSGTAPSGVQDWLENAEKVLEQVESAEIHQPMIGLDGYWYTWDQENEEYVKTNTKAQGSGADLIDDTTPSENKVFSSSKVNTELNTVKSDLTAVQNDVESVYITAETTGTAEAGAYTWVPCVMKKGIKYKIKIKASKPYNSDIEFSTAGSNQVYVTNPVGTLPANKTEVEIIHTPTTKDIAYIRFKVARSDSCVYTIKTYHLESSELSADIDVLNDDALLPASAIQITSSNYTDFFTDANYAPVGKTFSINSNITSAMITNLPSYGTTAILCTIPSMKGVVHGRIQIFSNSTGNVWFRFESGYDNIYNYTPWNSPTALNKMACKIFKKVVCCGDSYTSGHINTTGTAVDTNEDYAWPHYMETATGNEWVNCGVSGANVLTWQSAQRGLLKAQSCGKAQAYIVALGLNDSDSGSAHVDVGTSADIGTNAQTYYGGMSKIVRELNAINPTAKIFLNTVPNNAAQYSAYNQAVRDIVNAYKNFYPVYLMDLEANRLLYYNPTLLNDRVNGHYTALGYEQFAEIYAFLLSDYITNHFYSFQNVYTIPYESGND